MHSRCPGSLRRGSGLGIEGGCRRGFGRRGFFRRSSIPRRFSAGQPRCSDVRGSFRLRASLILAMTLARKSNGRVDGFVVEGEVAGGHNAPPRGPLQLSARANPCTGRGMFQTWTRFGISDCPSGWRARTGVPVASPPRPEDSEPRGSRCGNRLCILRGIRDPAGPEVPGLESQCGRPGPSVHRSGSVTHGFPFKVLRLPGTLSDPSIYESRDRICDLGYLRQPYRQADGSVGYRCPGEEVDRFVKKGGTESGAEGRKCLCNGLLATVGLGQVRDGGEGEPAILTAGEDVGRIAGFLKPGHTEYTAADVVQALLNGEAAG